MRKCFLSTLVLISSLLACQDAADPSQETLRVAVINYQHETCTFCPGGDTEIADWTKLGPLLEGEAVLEANSYTRGFSEKARAYGDIDLIGITSPDQVFGGSSRSWNTQESFDSFMTVIEQELQEQMPLQGVYLSLHGALAVRNIARPEAEIARRVRAVVGEEVPIVGSFDLHGNEDEQFLRWADGAFVTKRYPHYDSYLQGERAATYLRDIMQGRYIPTTASRKPPILTPTVVQWTGQSPSMDIMERARRWEARVRGAYVSVFYGFPWSDVPDVGTAVHVMTNNDQAMADSIAQDMHDFIWRKRAELVNRDYPMPKEAVERTITAIALQQTPVVLADYADRPGDATWILRELKDRQVAKVLYGCLTDEQILDSLRQQNAQVGDPFDMQVGGYTGEQAGAPVRITGTLRYFDKRFGYEKVAVVEWGEQNMLIITPAYTQITTPGRLAFGPIQPEDYDVFVTKSRVHFRRGFDETAFAKTILVTDAPGDWFGTIRLDALDYQFATLGELYPYGGGTRDEGRGKR